MLLFLFFTKMFSQQMQTPYQTTQKYWWYRYRLVNDFMKVGDNCGESIPASARHLRHTYYWNAYPWFVDPYKNGALEWGDATQYLGNYIMALATEYKMLSSSGLSTNRTLMELSKALNAFDRLDKNAEDYSWDIDGTYSCSPNGIYQSKRGKDPLNGFFIRDDVPIYNDPSTGYFDFVQVNFAHFNRAGRNNFGGLGQNVNAAVVSSGAFGDRININGQIQPYHNSWSSWKKRVPQEESQDQMVELYLGMGLTSRLLPNTATYNGVNLAKQAGNALFRMVHYAFYSYNGLGSTPKWQINNPVTTLCVYGIDPNYTCNAGGADIIHLGVGATIGLTRSALYTGSCSSGDISNIIGLTGPSYEALFQLTQFMPNNLGWPSRDLGYAFAYSNFANYWKQPAICGSFPFYYPCLKNSTQKVIKKGSYGFYSIKYPHHPMIYNIISGPGIGHGTGNIDPAEFNQPSWKELFSRAPDCGCYNYSDEGNFSGTNNNWGDWYWSSPDWAQNYDKRGAVQSPPGDYNNIDYMYLYNLYNLNDKEYLTHYWNPYYKENFNKIYPGTILGYPNPNGIGSNNRKLELGFLEYVSLVNINNAGSNVIYRGAKVVDLLPGFLADNGSDIVIQAKDYSCDEDIYYYAKINGHPIVDVGTGSGIFGRGNENELNATDGTPNTQDTIDALDLAPYELEPEDNPDYNADEMDNRNDEELTQEEIDLINNYKDSLMNIVYTSGDDYLIQKMEEMFTADSNNNAFKTTPALQEKDNSRKNITDTLSVFPNPSDGIFRIQTVMNNYYISVYSSLGELIQRSTNISGNYNLNLSGKPKGIYLLNITSDKGIIIHSFKLILK